MMIAAEPFISMLLLMAFLVFVAPFALVGAVVYAIVKKRPRAFFGVLGALALLLVIAVGGIIVSIFGSRMVNSATVHIAGFPAVRAVSAGAPTSIGAGKSIVNPAKGSIFEGVHMSFMGMVVIAILSLIALKVVTQGPRAGAGDDHRQGWGLGRVILVVIVIIFVAKALPATKENSDRARAIADRQRAIMAKQEAEMNHHHTAASAIESPANMQASIEQLWDHLNRPKIDLHTEEVWTPEKIAVQRVAQNQAIQSAKGNQAAAGGSGMGAAAQSLAETATVFGKLLADASLSAQRLANTCKLISRAMASTDEPDESTATIATASAERTARAAAGAKPVPSHRSASRVETVAANPVVKSADAAELHEKIGGEAPVPKGSRPTWVDEPQKQVGNVLRQVVVAGSYATPEECYAKTDELLKIATDNYVKQFSGGKRDDLPLTTEQEGSPLVKIMNFRSSALEQMGVDVAYIRREIAKDEYQETVERSVGPMKNLYTLMEFSPDVDRELRIRWEEMQRGGRLTAVGLLSGSIIGVIGLVFGLLKVDTATKGYYSKRLFLGVPALIILGMLLLGGLLTRVASSTGSLP